MTNFILIIVALLYSILGIVFAVEIGECLLSINSKFAVEKSKLNLNSAPWLSLNSLLLLTNIGLIVVINKTLFSYDQSIRILLWVSLIILLLKGLIRLYIRHSKSIGRLTKQLYLTVCYLVLIVFTEIGVYLLTGKQFKSTAIGWVLILIVLIGATLNGLAYPNRSSKLIKAPKLRRYLIILFAVWSVFLGFIFPVALAHYNTALIGTSITVLEVVVAVSFLGYGYATFFQKKPQELYQYTFLMSFLIPIILAWNNRPYLISMKVKLSDAFSLNSYENSGHWLIIILMIFASLTLLNGIYVLVSLILDNSSLK